MTDANEIAIRPQPGPQAAAHSSSADVLVFGGAAGGGKTRFLVTEPLRYLATPGFTAVIFRRALTQAKKSGGLWDEMMSLYPLADGHPRINAAEWLFPSGAKIQVGSIEHESSTLEWQGSQICYLAFDELTHFCYNPVMETLTDSGWKRIADVRPGEKVLALTPDGDARYEDVTEAWSFDFDGELHETSNRSIRYSVTPNHKMIIRRQGHQEWEFCEAKNLDRFPQYPFDSEWHGSEREWVELPPQSGRGIGTNQNSVERMDADTYLELLGWFLAEGSAFLASKKRNTSPCISIRQTKSCPELHALMSRVPLRSKFVEGDGYRIFSKQLYAHWKPLGNLYEKRVPRWVMSLSRRQLKLIFDAFTLGDGHLCKTGAIAFGLANEGLVDDFQEIAAKLGHRSTKSVGMGGKNNVYISYRLYVHARKGGLVCDKPCNKRLVPYKGKVHCITVEPSHTLLVRHEGRVSWSGNSESMFWYMFSRNRSMCGVRPYIRATTNPVSQDDEKSGWVNRLVAWWIDQDTGFAIQERSGVVRWFVRDHGELVWGDSADELKQRYPLSQPKSFTFIGAKLDDNPALTKSDPDYRANLMALPPVEQARLLGGNWKVRPSQGMFFKIGSVPILDAAPTGLRWCRAWDLAATEGATSDPTAGVKIGVDAAGRYVVADVTRGHWAPDARDARIKLTAEMDGKAIPIRFPQDPGQASIDQKLKFARMLAGWNPIFLPVVRDKATRATGFAAQVNVGNVSLVRGAWNASFLAELDAFTGENGGRDDQVDAAADAFNWLTRGANSVIVYPDSALR